MNRGAWILAALAANLFAHADPLSAQSASRAQGFESFKMVRTRNIFDPDRQPPPSSLTGGSRANVAVTRADYVALTGTLVTKDKALAFFSGSRSDFDCVLPVKDKIAGATITKITSGNVTVEIAGKPALVAVGWTVPLNGAASAPAPTSDALPAPATAFGAVPSTAAAMVANPAAGAAPPATSPPAATPNPDVARMMRERRQRESQ